MNKTKPRSNYNFEEDYFQPIVQLYLLSVNLYKKFFSNADFNITPQQWTALNRLWQKDGISQAQLANLTYKDFTFTTRLVDDLEKQKLVRRERATDDRRINKIYLTDNGKILKSKIFPVYQKMSDSLRAGVSDDELKNLIKLCNKLIENYLTQSDRFNTSRGVN